MTTRHWMQVAALVSAFGLTGTAIAQDTDRSTSTRDESGISAKEAPAAGAIVMPDDVVKPGRTPALNKDNARPGDRNGQFNDDNSVANDDRLSVNPGPSGDEMSVNPAGPNDDMAVDPGRVRAQPGEMGPASVRGE